MNGTHLDLFAGLSLFIVFGASSHSFLFFPIISNHILMNINISGFQLNKSNESNNSFVAISVT